MGYFQFTRVVIYDRRSFIRLTTGPAHSRVGWCKFAAAVAALSEMRPKPPPPPNDQILSLVSATQKEEKIYDIFLWRNYALQNIAAEAVSDMTQTKRPSGGQLLWLMAQLVEWLILTPDIRGSNPDISKLFLTIICIKYVMKRRK